MSDGKPWVKDLAIFSVIVSEVVGLPLVGFWIGRKIVNAIPVNSNFAYLFALTGFVIAMVRIRRYRKV